MTENPASTATEEPGSFDAARSLREEADQSFATFYRSTIRLLVAFLINQGAAVDVAADIAQDTMMAAYERWSDLHSPRGWVHKVASRALVRKVASFEEQPVGEVPEPTALLARPDAIKDWETHHDALPMLRTLPPRQRQVMAWTLAGFTPTDIAEWLGGDLTSEAVRANLAKARRSAAAYYEAREEER
ncbi:sigma-70 family RNA polymerase sigma factor [Streptomyces sp. NPDC058739]|uniref:sigma-70 family RNA polymerase sigma factor n=1 Tax=Streptomyces sp. NPDC058739 TaxID=3346618 RepID=UPI0036A79CA5